MLKVRRGWVAFSLSAYLLTVMAVHFLHDHSGAHAHCSTECAVANSGESSATPHDHDDCPAGPCEDSCFACRFLAIQSIAPTLVAPAPLVERVAAIPEPVCSFVSAPRPSLPLTRGPPCV